MNDFNDLGRYDMIQRLSKANAEADREARGGMGAIAVVALVATGAILGAGILTLSKGCVREPMPAIKAGIECGGCHEKAMFTAYFKRNGSRSPQEMAEAVLRTKNPRLLAAVAVTESNGNHRVRNSGFRKRHSGAYQVNPRYHGKVPHDALNQTLQAERILTELTQNLPIEKALAVYGGDSTDRYSKKILAELMRAP
ncbi:MAG: hypothetical protein WCP20_11165 [Desulfuromonadales bacterium]